MNKYNFNKNLLSLILSGAISLSMSGCSKQKEQKENNTNPSSASDTINTSVTKTTTAVESNDFSKEEKNIYDINGHRLKFTPIYQEENVKYQSYTVSYTEYYKYITKIGETLNDVSKSCDVNISQIKELNENIGIDYNKTNFEDQVIPSNTQITIKKIKEYPYMVSSKDYKSLCSIYEKYIVEDGDCLYDIAIEKNTSVKLIKILNDLDDNTIYGNQPLLIPTDEYIKVYKKIN